MKLKNVTEEELENMSYDDIAYEILNETGKKIKITDLFKEICSLLKLSDAVYERQIGDFFQVLSTDQRFTMLDDGYWDLKSRHKSNIVMDLEDDEDVVVNEEEEPDLEEDEEKDEELYYDDDVDDDEAEDELKDLVIIGEDEEDKDIM